MPKTKYIWDEEDDVVSMEKDENGATTAVYTHEPGLHGELISQRRGETTSYYHYDGLGSTVALTNESEEVTDTYRYKAYGEPVAATGSTVNPFRWVGSRGYYWGEELRQYSVRARHYDPATSQFISRDPIGFAAGDANLYRYVFNAPLLRTDPTGNAGFYDSRNPHTPLWPGGPIPAEIARRPPPPRRPPSPPFPRAKTSNTKLFWGGVHYRFCCPRKKTDRLVTIQNPGTRPTPPPPGWGLSGGSNQFNAGPGEVGGCHTCIGVVISCPSGGTAVFHFNTEDNPGRTLDDWTWPANCEAIVCGGNDEKVSNCLADDVLEALKTEGIKVIGVSGAGRCGVDAKGDFYEAP